MSHARCNRRHEPPHRVASPGAGHVHDGAATGSSARASLTVDDLAVSSTAPAVQLRALDQAVARAQTAASMHATAAAGVRGGGQALPYAETIQQRFGRHDISRVRAHTGGDAARASAAMGAMAYARGDDVAFGRGPDLFTAAHEAAHVVQQRAGVSLRSGVGSRGDAYERHADEVAAAVVSGRSAEALLDRFAGSGGRAGRAVVQRRGDDAPAPSSQYDGSEMAPNEDDAELLNAIATKLASHAQFWLDDMSSDKDTSVQFQAGLVLRAEVEKVQAAMGGKGDWRSIVDRARGGSVEDAVWIMVEQAIGKGFEAALTKLEARVQGNVQVLRASYSNLAAIAKAVRSSEATFEGLGDLFTLMEYLDKALGKAASKASPNRSGRTLGKTDDLTHESVDPTAGVGGVMTQNPYEAASEICDKIVESGLARRLGERNAYLECVADGGSDAECFRLLRGLDGTLKDIKKVTTSLKRDQARLERWQTYGLTEKDRPHIRK
ncbi:MAG: DUF4157 domain-containing protein [Deltaproteobacteria bacterium]|nr:DUF4157 domain-containing protein [Deltaproteobacteria bacterium]